MRLCGLRAAFAATADADSWVLHDPRLWLGSAFHEVIQTLRSGGAQNPAEIWDTEIARAARAAQEHPLDKRYSSPQKWPSYFLVRQRCLSMASKAPKRKVEVKSSQVQTALPTFVRGAERRSEARNGQLVGKPDYFDGDIITEYKSSLPNPQWEGAADIVESFKRQLRLYAAIIADVTERWPTGARIVAASGQALEFPISQAECDHEADDAVAALNRLNVDLASACAPERMANPSAPNCAGCDFKIICPAFWQSLAGGDLRAIRATAIDGVLLSVEDGPDGDLYTAKINVVASSQAGNSEQQIVLRESIHGELSNSAVGGRVRVIDFNIRGDGRIRAERKTVVVATSSLPLISVIGSG